MSPAGHPPGAGFLNQANRVAIGVRQEGDERPATVVDSVRILGIEIVSDADMLGETEVEFN